MSSKPKAPGKGKGSDQRNAALEMLKQAAAGGDAPGNEQAERALSEKTKKEPLPPKKETPAIEAPVKSKPALKPPTEKKKEKAPAQPKKKEKNEEGLRTSVYLYEDDLAQIENIEGELRFGKKIPLSRGQRSSSFFIRLALHLFDKDHPDLVDTIEKLTKK